MATDPRVDALIEAAARPFAAAGRFARHFARGKLRHDPVYLALLERGVFPERGRVLDIGCGQGILLALLVAAREQYLAGKWPAGWPTPPASLRLRGIELRPIDVQRARRALGPAVEVEERDVRVSNLAASDVVVLLDVLHYLDRASQEVVLARAAEAVTPRGTLIVRVGNAANRVAACLTRTVDWVVTSVRDRRAAPLQLRALSEWISLLESFGMHVSAAPLDGTPFANVLLIARRSRR